MRILRVVSVALCVSLSPLALAGDPAPATATPAPARCEHGVKKSLCTRCNPKLEAVFKAKNDWCGEHSKPESQCVECHPELAKQGIK